MRLSPILLIVLIIVVTALSCNAQIDTKKLRDGGILKGGDMVRFNITLGGTSSTAEYNRIDTVKSYLLVSMLPTNSGMPKPLYTLLGYEIIKKHGYMFECSYLREDKTQLEKYYVVWMSKQIRDDKNK